RAARECSRPSAGAPRARDEPHRRVVAWVLLRNVGSLEGARERRRAGIRRGLPLGIAVFAISISFGVLARPVMGTVAPIVMSILVFSGAAQFGALAVLIAGGGAGAAIAAGVLLNARYLAMGVALAPSLRGRAPSRAPFALP